MSRILVVISFFVLIMSGIVEDKALLSYSGLIIAILIAIFAIIKSQNKFDRTVAALMIMFCVIKVLVKILIYRTGGA